MGTRERSESDTPCESKRLRKRGLGEPVKRSGERQNNQEQLRIGPLTATPQDTTGRKHQRHNSGTSSTNSSNRIAMGVREEPTTQGVQEATVQINSQEEEMDDEMDNMITPSQLLDAAQAVTQLTQN
jgi:hypothetical protein